MGLPRKLKAMAIFVNGVHYAGECTEVTPPTFERELEDYRAGGMGDASGPRLTDSAERDYFTLRGRIITITGQVSYLQEYIRTQCLK